MNKIINFFKFFYNPLCTFKFDFNLNVQNELYKLFQHKTSNDSLEYDVEHNII